MFTKNKRRNVKRKRVKKFFVIRVLMEGNSLIHLLQSYNIIVIRFFRRNVYLYNYLEMFVSRDEKS